MQFRRLFLPVLCLLVTSCFGLAQVVVSVDSKTFNQHLLRSVPLLYPPIAKAAHVQGTVVLQVQVGVTGKVESIKAISGPPMLIQAAIDSVKHWSFLPFKKKGSAVRASGQTSLVFALAGIASASDKLPKKERRPSPSKSVVIVRVMKSRTYELAQSFVDAQRECANRMAQQKGDEATAIACKKAADIAQQFRADDDLHIDKLHAFLIAATSLKNSGDLTNALAYATKAVDVTELGHDIEDQISAAHAIRGTIEFYLGDLSAADQDLRLSEEHERKAIAWAEKEAPKNLPSYKQLLSQELRFHASVSSHLNETENAKEELTEASKL